MPPALSKSGRVSGNRPSVAYLGIAKRISLARFPDFGRQLEEAAAILDGLGLRVGLVKHVRDENYLPETIMEQSVEEATELEVGEEIDLIVSTTE